VFVGIGRLELRVPASASLKSKRHVVKAITGGLRAKFNVAVAEVDHLESWQLTSIGVVCVSNAGVHIRQVFQEVERFVAREHRAELLSFDIEVVVPEDQGV